MDQSRPVTGARPSPPRFPDLRAARSAAAAGIADTGPRPAEDRELQQLRGVFAAFDAGGKGELSQAELSAALLALGAEPTVDTLSRFRLASTSSTGTDVDAFLRVCSTHLTRPGVRSTAPAIRELLDAFRDASGDEGTVTLGALRHLLCEVVTPSALSVQEATDLFRMTGLLPMSMPPARATRAMLDLPVDAEDARRKAEGSGADRPSLTTLHPAELVELLCFRAPGSGQGPKA